MPHGRLCLCLVTVLACFFLAPSVHCSGKLSFLAVSSRRNLDRAITREKIRVFCQDQAKTCPWGLLHVQSISQATHQSSTDLIRLLLCPVNSNTQLAVYAVVA
ncbi:hypothetical protein BDW71DRAFT_96642 [Aspergillus fruticulosus]